MEKIKELIHNTVPEAVIEQKQKLTVTVAWQQLHLCLWRLELAIHHKAWRG